MTDHATEAERFHNEYLRIRTPGQLPTTADALALANYHATMAVADAIRGTRDDRCDAGSPFWGRSACRLPKGHSDPHFYPLNPTQDAGGSPQNDAQPKPAHEDSPDAVTTGERRAEPRVRLTDNQGRDASHLLDPMAWMPARTFDQVVVRAEEAEAERDAILDDLRRLEAQWDNQPNVLQRGAFVRAATQLGGIIDHHTPEG